MTPRGADGADGLEAGGVLEVVDDLGQLGHRVAGAGHIGEGDGVLRGLLPLTAAVEAPEADDLGHGGVTASWA